MNNHKNLLSIVREAGHHDFMLQSCAILFPLALVIRLQLFLNPYSINPDGVYYIQQAQAIYFHDFKKVTACGLTFVSIYPIAIAFVQSVLNDWLLSAKIVSLVFGTITVIPVFFTAKLFFDKHIAILVGLVYAVIPSMVSRSIDVVRDPVYWFFFAMAIYWTIKSCGKGRQAIGVVIASIFFVLASLTRVEASVAWVASGIYIAAKHRRMLVPFLVPVLILSLVACVIYLILDINISSYVRVSELLSRINGPILTYNELRDTLQNQINESNNFVLRSFLGEARRGVWILAIGVLVNRFFEAYFYPYAGVVLVGLIGIGGKIKADVRVQYFVVLYVAGLCLLYHVTNTNWVMEYRYMAIVVIPCLLLLGYGLEEVVSVLVSFFKIKREHAVLFVGVVVFLVSAPKNFKHEVSADMLYREAGEIVARNESGAKEVLSFSSLPAQLLVSFYANRKNDSSFYKRNWYLEGYGKDFKPTFAALADFVGYMQKRSILYFLWEENNLPETIKSLRNEMFLSPHFLEVGRWQHKEAGEMRLFRVIP